MDGPDTVLLVSLVYLGSPIEGQADFAPLMSLGPLVVDEKRIPFAKMMDPFDMFCVHGGFKKFDLAELPRFGAADVEVLVDILAGFEKMMEKCPDAERTRVGFAWVGKGDEDMEADESAFGHRDVKT